MSDKKVQAALELAEAYLAWVDYSSNNQPRYDSAACDSIEWEPGQEPECLKIWRRLDNAAEAYMEAKCSSANLFSHETGMT